MNTFKNFGRYLSFDAIKWENRPCLQFDIYGCQVEEGKGNDVTFWYSLNITVLKFYRESHNATM